MTNNNERQLLLKIFHWAIVNDDLFSYATKLKQIF